MSDATKRMKVNQKLAAHKCTRCGERLEFGEDAVVCLPCKRGYHASCWDDAGGCANEGCENAALTQIEPPAGAAEVPPGKKKCPHCGKINSSRAKICRSCKKVPTADGVYRGRKTTAPGATASLVYGILSIFICGIIFGLLAIQKSNEAKAAMDRDPSYEGEGLATAGKIIGIIGLVGWGLMMLLRLTGAFGQ